VDSLAVAARSDRFANMLAATLGEAKILGQGIAGLSA